MDKRILSNGVEMPPVGFGTYKAAADDGQAVFTQAVRAGYRLFDTASFYGTEEALGRAAAACGLPRTEFFLATKAWKTELGYDNILRACDASCRRLGVEQLDLYLLHWPKPDPDYQDWEALDRESWRAMERLYEQGRVRSIGVCNFLVHHLQALLSACNVPPMVDQVEFHPGYTQWETVRFCQERNILPQAWSPLGRQRLAGHPLLEELAQTYQVTPQQLCLRFAVQCGVVPLPKTTHPRRMGENLDLDGFALSARDMARLHAMPRAGWSGEHPDHPRVRV